MNEERKKILDMLANGKIDANQAESLLNAIESKKSMDESRVTSEKKGLPKFLKIEVHSKNSENGGEQVNIRVPFQILRSGIKLASLMPNGVQEKVTHALNDKGIELDLSKVKNEDLESLITDLADLSIDVNNENENVRICCE